MDIVPQALTRVFETALSVASRPPSTLDQNMLNVFIKQGHFGRHLRRMRNVHQQRRAALVQSNEETISEHLEIVGSDAGLHCTARLIDGQSASRIAEKIQSKGFVVRHLWEYELIDTPPHERSEGLVFGFACAPPTRICAAIKSIRSCFQGSTVSLAAIERFAPVAGRETRSSLCHGWSQTMPNAMTGSDAMAGSFRVTRSF